MMTKMMQIKVIILFVARMQRCKEAVITNRQHTHMYTHIQIKFEQQRKQEMPIYDNLLRFTCYTF